MMKARSLESYVDPSNHRSNVLNQVADYINIHASNRTLDLALFFEIAQIVEEIVVGHPTGKSFDISEVTCF